MKQKELSRWMKAIVVLGFICVLFLDAVWVPELGKDLAGNTPELQRMFWPCLIYFWISTIPVMVFMALVWKMATEIGRDNSFCYDNARRLRMCSNLALAKDSSVPLTASFANWDWRTASPSSVWAYAPWARPSPCCVRRSRT